MTTVPAETTDAPPGWVTIPLPAAPPPAPGAVSFPLPAAVPPPPPPTKLSKAQRMLARLFPGAPRYVPRKGTYSAMPWVLRRAIGLFAVREWQVLTYLFLRSGPESLVWLADKQIACDLDVGPRKIGPHIRALEKKGFIQTAEHDGQRYVLLLDPEAALHGLAASGLIPPRIREALTEDLETIGLAALPPAALPPVPGGAR